MFKKILVIFVMFFTLVGCNSSEYIPTAIVSNIVYNENTLQLQFQVDVTDKSQTLQSVTVELHNDTIVSSQRYDDLHSIYTFDNVNSDSGYSIKIKATYFMNDTLIKDKEIYSVDITNYLSSKYTYFSSRTFAYNGEKHSIYLTNLNPEYTVKYSNNEQSEIGIYTVTAEVYDQYGNLEETYTAYLVITESASEIFAVDQEHYYTSNPISAVFIASNNADTIVTYNGSTEVPVEVGEYLVVIDLVDDTVSYHYSVQIVMIIKQVDVEIFSTNKVVVENDSPQGIDVITNVSCESTVTYDGSETRPTLPGVYEVVITVKETQNHKSSVKYLTLTILETDEIKDVNELFVSQVVYTSDFDIIIEIYNPTSTTINLNDYSIVIGNESNNKSISLIGSISSLSTYTIATTSTVYLDIEFNQYSSYLVASENETISLSNDEIIDEIKLGFAKSYIRNSVVGFPNDSFDESEWGFYTNDVRATINTHVYDYSEYSDESYYEVSFKEVNYISLGKTVDFNDHIIIMSSNERINVVSSMIKSNNININLFGTYTVEFEIGDYEFETKFIVTDLVAPVITVKNTNLTFELTDTIDYLSLINVEDTSTIKEITYKVDDLTLGANAVTYTAVDEYGNKSVLTIYIFII